MKTGRPRGRPKLPPGLKADQFSIALAPTARIGLEMLARHRRVSLSKAVEYCVSLALKGYQIDGEELSSRLHVEVPAGHPSLDEDWAAQLLASPGKRVMWMPKSLLTPEEEFFARVVGLVGADAEIVEGDLDELLELAKVSFARGVREEDLAEHWTAAQIDKKFDREDVRF